MGEAEFYGLVGSFTDEGGYRCYRVGRRGYEHLRLWRRVRVLAGPS